MYMKSFRNELHASQHKCVVNGDSRGHHEVVQDDGGVWQSVVMFRDNRLARW